VNYAIIQIIDLLFRIFTFLIFVEVIGSWVLAAMRTNLPSWVYDILGVIHSITAPVLDPIRRLMPSLGGLDISPIIVLLLLDLLRSVIIRALMGSL
jgi:YggT family protein